MRADDLLAEAAHLARPCILLVSQPHPAGIAAIWGGSGGGRPNGGDTRHRLTLDCRFLPPDGAPLTGCISIYERAVRDATPRITHDPMATLPADVGSGIPLYPQSARSLPPLEALFRFGSPAIETWLMTQHWQRTWEYTDNFPDRRVANAYLQRYHAEHPLYTGAAFAVLGGWPFPWPDGDWEDLLDEQLLVWTLHDAEPWVEVWRDQLGNLHGIERVT